MELHAISPLKSCLKHEINNLFFRISTADEIAIIDLINETMDGLLPTSYHLSYFENWMGDYYKNINRSGSDPAWVNR